MNYILVLGGLVALVIGGDLLVRGSVSAARSLGVSPLIIGLTLVGFGTSTPELVTSIQAAMAGSPGIAVGNVVGSNISNVLLIVGVSALLKPILVDPRALKRDGLILLLTTLGCVAFALYGSIGRMTGLISVITLAMYLAITVYLEKRRESPATDVYESEAATIATPTLGLAGALLLATLGLVVTVAGARVLVFGAIGLAEAIGLSEAVIGLTIVAIGTSMPELVTSIVAVMKGESDVAFGNIIGSNLFNLLGILGVTALLKPVQIPAEIAAIDIWVLLVSTITLLVFASSGWRIGRREGGVMLVAFVCYLAALLLR